MVVVPDREPLTMLEAQRIGASADKLARLRRLRTDALKPTSGQIVVGAGYAALNIHLGSDDLAAAIGFLMEREEAFLRSMNVQIERPE